MFQLKFNSHTTEVTHQEETYAVFSKCHAHSKYDLGIYVDCLAQVLNW